MILALTLALTLVLTLALTLALAVTPNPALTVGLIMIFALTVAMAPRLGLGGGDYFLRLHTPFSIVGLAR